MPQDGYYLIFSRFNASFMPYVYKHPAIAASPFPAAGDNRDAPVYDVPLGVQVHNKLVRARVRVYVCYVTTCIQLYERIIKCAYGAAAATLRSRPAPAAAVACRERIWRIYTSHLVILIRLQFMLRERASDEATKASWCSR